MLYYMMCKWETGISISGLNTQNHNKVGCILPASVAVSLGRAFARGEVSTTHTPPFHGQTDAYKNIILPQTSFADGKYVLKQRRIHIRGGSRILHRRRRQSSRRGRQPTILPTFSKKLHEIEKLLGHGGHPPL